MTDNNQKPEFEILDVEWAKDLEDKFEDYMWKCESLVDGDEEAEGFETLSKQPFCGCTTCYSREQLFFLVPKIIKAYKEGKIELTEEVAE